MSRLIYTCSFYPSIPEFNFTEFVKLVSTELSQQSLDERKQDLRKAFGVFDFHETGI